MSSTKKKLIFFVKKTQDWKVFQLNKRETITFLGCRVPSSLQPCHLQKTPRKYHCCFPLFVPYHHRRFHLHRLLPHPRSYCLPGEGWLESPLAFSCSNLVDRFLERTLKTNKCVWVVFPLFFFFKICCMSSRKTQCWRCLMTCWRIMMEKNLIVLSWTKNKVREGVRRDYKAIFRLCACPNLRS